MTKPTRTKNAASVPAAKDTATARIAGFHAVLAQIRTDPQRLRMVWLDRRRRDERSAQLQALASGADITLQLTDKARLDQLSDNARHQGVVAELQVDERAREHSEADLGDLIRAAPNPLLLVLDGVQDPHNLGACLRSAAATGVTAVITPDHHCVGLSATVRKVASGGAESVPLIRVTNLARCLRSLQENGIWLIGTAEDSSDSVYAADLSDRCAIICGGEGKGMRSLTRQHCDHLVHIPMAQSPVQSLNISVAAAVVLFEAIRQRGARPNRHQEPVRE